MNFAEQLASYTAHVETGLDLYLPSAAERPQRLHEAIRYAAQGGGKRLRPVLTLAAADLLRANTQKIEPQKSKTPNALPAGKADALPAAIAVECIHTYSLVHDDLPCMDNDDLRRGRATTHKAFDEATALLAGDALLTHAFTLLAEHYPAALARDLIRELAAAAGSRRLIGGQMADLLAEKQANATAAELEFIHLNKTAAMIEAALVMGGLIGNANEDQITALRLIGCHLGLAFQILDDVLDATVDTATLGKTAGKDAQADKTTYVKLYGVERARQLAATHTDKAIAALASLPGRTAFLIELTRSLTTRVK